MSQPATTQSESRNLPEPNVLLEDILRHRGWSVREGQMKMVQAVEETVTSRANINGVVVNAPVGTGKTLGYLTGALPSDGRILVCTSTKALQDQIVTEELPRLAGDLKELYGFDLKFAVLKGRSNYVCIEKARNFLEGKSSDEEEAQLFSELSLTMEPSEVELINKIITRTEKAMQDHDVAHLDAGDLMEGLPPRVRSAISSASRCSQCRKKWWTEVEDSDDDGDDLGYWDPEEKERRALSIDEVLETSGCAYRTAYALALQADILVVNTALMAAEMLKSRFAWEYSPQLLRGVRVMVMDEAHRLARILTGALSTELDFADVSESVSTLFRRLSRRIPEQESRLMEAVRITEIAHEDVIEIIDTARPSKLRPLLADRLNEYSTQITQVVEAAMVAIRTDTGLDEKITKSVTATCARIQDEVLEPVGVAARVILQQVENEDTDQMEYSFDVTFLGGDDGEALSVQMVPIDLSFFRNEIGWVNVQENLHVKESGLQRHDEHISTMVLCSGTITSETGYIVGMGHSNYHLVPSPYDPLRGRLCVPLGLPNPNDDDWFDQAWEVAKTAIRAAGGRTLFLCTSHYRKELFADKLLEEMPEYTVVYQGNGMSRTELLRTLTDDETSILVGTESFFEGVDVPGPSVSLVILDKIPFPMRDDAVFSAQRKYVEKHDGNPFIEVDVNHAAIMFGQMFGRLQRKESDLGGVIVLESRVEHHRMYGSLITRLLPATTPFTSDVDVFCEWLQWCVEHPGEEEVPEPDSSIWRPLRVPRPRRRRSGS